MAISAADLLKLRGQTHTTKLYLIVQQPHWQESSAWTGHFWEGTLTAAPGTTNDELSVNSGSGLTLIDGMTVLIDSTTVGGHNRGVFKVHGDQTIGAGAETLYISNSGELGEVQNGDKIVVLDEFRYWPRYPKVTESGGTLSWFKDWGYFRDSLAADGYTWAQLASSEAVYPPTPIMGPHRVAFIDPDVGSVDIDFDWSDSYTMTPGGTVNAWASAGEDGGAGWSSALENPAAQTYSNLSGLAGYRTTLSVLTDKADPIIEFRRGMRYVFTLRRPDQYQSGDPTPESHYTPIVDFEVSSITGDFQSGSWQTSIRIFGSVASEYDVQPGALVILFAEDWYQGTKESLGPIEGSENVVLVGHIADGTILQDSENGDVTFDIISLAEQASRRENYPVPVTNDDTPTEWTDAQDLTVSRAAWWFTAWHSNLAQVTDVFADVKLNGVSDAREVAGQDFLAGDLFRASLDSFLSGRLVGRVLMDRYERAAFVINRQVQTVGGANTLFDLAAGDWIGQVQLREINESPANIVEAGGVLYNAGTITPYLSIAPGNVSGYIGTNQSSNFLAVTGQAQLNTISGDLYAYYNNKWPDLILKMAGNWRFGDLWPQEYIDVDLTLDRYTLTNEDFLIRSISFDYDATQGVMMTTYRCEYETDGPDGVTVPILAELDPSTGETDTPPKKPLGFGGTCLICTDDGVFITYNFLDDTPVWSELNDGLGASGTDPRYVWSLREDPNNPGEWWATTDAGVYYNDSLLSGGTWTQLLSIAEIQSVVSTALNLGPHAVEFCALKPDYVAVSGWVSGGNLFIIDNNSNGASGVAGDWRGRTIGGHDSPQSNNLAVSYHLNAGGTDIRCLMIGSDAGIDFLDDTGDTSGAFTLDTDPNTVSSGDDFLMPITLWKTSAYDDDSGYFIHSASGAETTVMKTSAFLDGGPGTTVAAGDAAMVAIGITGGRVMWTDIINTYLYASGEDFMWYSDDDGSSWTKWGDTYPVADPTTAEGDISRGIVVAFNPAAIAVYYNPDSDDWHDKTGNLGTIAAETTGYCIYLLDV